MTVFEKTLQSLADESQEITDALLGLLSGASKSEAAAFSAVWSGLPIERRRLITSKMVELSERRFDLDYAALYRVCLSDRDAEVRRNAIDGLWEDEGWDLPNIFIRILQSDPEPIVRAAAAMSLGRFIFMAECDEFEPARAVRIRAALEKAINDPQEAVEVRRRAVEALSFINDERITEIIEQAYAERDEAMKASALFAMGRNADPAWADIVLEELENASAMIRFEAVRASGELQLEKAAAKLVKLTQDPDAEIKAMAIWALGQIGGKQAESTLHQLAHDPNEATSEAALDALDSLEFVSRPMDLIVHGADEEPELGEVDLGLTDEGGAEEDEDEDTESGTDDANWDDEPLELD